MARLRSNGAETSGLSAIALGLTQSVNKEIKQVNTGAGLGVSDQAVEFGTSMGEFFRGEGSGDFLDKTEETLGEMFDGSPFKNIEDLRNWCHSKDHRDNLTPEEISTMQVYYDIVDAATLATLASAGRMNGDVVEALGDRDPEGRVVEEALGIKKTSPLVGLGEMMIDVAIVDPGYIEVLEGLNRAVNVGDYRGGVSDALRKMNDKDYKDPNNPEWEMVVTYLHEMRAAGDNQNRVSGLRRIPVARSGENGEGAGVDYVDATYDMKLETFVDLEKNRRPIRWYGERPPAWYESMDEDQRDIIMLRVKLLEHASNKHELRNINAEKLRQNIPELTNKEFRLLWEKMPGFKEAAQRIVRDLCEEWEDPNGRHVLRLKTNGLGADGNPVIENGQTLNPNGVRAEVKACITNFGRYRVRVASGLHDGMRLSFQDATAATSTAWNFLYLTDLIESADYYREFPPSDEISDQLRTINHPGIKAMGKWGVWKGHGAALAEDGDKESFASGDLFRWVNRMLRTHGDQFKRRMIDGDLKDMLPRTLCVSALETIKINVDSRTGTNLGLALLNRDLEWIGDRLPPDNTNNLLQSYGDLREGAEWFADVVRGRVDAWKTAGFVESFYTKVSLIHQQACLPDRNGVLLPLADCYNPRVLGWALLSSIGMRTALDRPIPDVRRIPQADGNAVVAALIVKKLVDECIQGLDDNDALRTGGTLVDKREVLRVLSSESPISVVSAGLSSLLGR